MACINGNDRNNCIFLLERGTVAASWRTSLTVAGLVTGVAFVHYMYMREVWVSTGDSPTVYRYIDWLITVPLQMIEFYLILAAVRKGANFYILEAINWFISNVNRWILR